MARHFLRLKLRLLRNGLRGNWQRAVGLVVGAVIVLPLGVVGFAVLAAFRAAPADGRVAAVIVFSLLFAGWAFLPLLGFGTDETLDPARLALLPLRRRQVVAGLFVASLVGVAPLATIVTLLGSLIGFTTRPLAVPIVAMAIAVELALCICASRAMVTTLSGLLRSRRGRDLTFMAAALFGVLLQVARLALFPDDGGLQRSDLEGPTAWLQWSPPGLAARAMVDADGGRYLVSMVELLCAAGFVVLLTWWWATALDRALTTVEASRSRNGRRVTPLFSGPLRLLPRTRLGAVAAKELHYLVRDPRRRVLLLSSLVLPVAMVFPVIARSGPLEPRTTLAALGVTLATGQIALNQFGLDGTALWLNVAAANDTSADLTGKNLAVLLTVLPLVLLTAVVLATITGGWVYVPLVLVLAVAVSGVQLGVGNVTSVRVPQPVPESSTNAWAANTGQGCAGAVLVLAAFFLQVVLLVPVAIALAVGLGTSSVVLVLALSGALAYGGGLWWFGRRSAVRWLWWRQPELLEVISPRRA